MNTSLKLKLGLLAAIIVFSVLAIVPSFYPGAPSWWKKYLAPEGLKLGLDLQGGVHMVLRVDLKEAAEKSLDIAANQLRNALAEKEITAVQLDSGETGKVIFTLPNTGAVSIVQELIKDRFQNLNITVDAEKGSFPRITLQLTQEQIDYINDNAVNQSLEIIRNRIDQFGVAEPVIIRQGEDEIVVQLPGIKDQQRALDLIGKTAQLEFKLVADDTGIDLNQLISSAIASGQWQPDGDRRELNLALQDKLPPGTEIYFEKRVDNLTRLETKVPILLKTPVLMTGDMVQDAKATIGGSYNEPYVSLTLTGEGKDLFAKITEQNVGKRLAIILDEVVRSAPVIRERILGGNAQISGSFTLEEARDLAIVLRAGALPAPIYPIQNLTVGASLGKDSIHKGLKSGLLGAMLVLLFMVIYYRLSGIIADLSLALNILLLFVGLAMLSATLTLPGIAGIILSIGMAVDANVLIFERMREEFALGKSVKSGVDGGFNKAFWSIVDSQVTTLITALALFMFGTGPIKGFAVTLSLGIIFNLFAVLFGSRLVYESLYSTRKLKELKFMKFVHKPSFDFMKVRNFAFGVSGLMVLIGLFAFVQILRGQANLGVDFAGGSMLQYKAEKPFLLKEIRTAFAKNGWDNITPQHVENENRLILKVKVQEETVGHFGKEITQILNSELPDKGFVLESQSEIGSSISAVLRNKAILAIAISLLGVLCYLALRFDLSFGVAAAAATFHDVLAVLGFCWLIDMEITLLIVTALLTLAGYSLNDSVVIFDRIRENMQKQQGKNFFDTINISINQVLGRSIVTSLTTALVLISLVLFGGSAIGDFSLALLAGVIVGTYSSIFVASPILSLWPRKE
ncbi:MAG: protein translocase subunit SecDF [Desulfobulbaceae bacterium]